MTQTTTTTSTNYADLERAADLPAVPSDLARAYLRYRVHIRNSYSDAATPATAPANIHNVQSWFNAFTAYERMLDQLKSGTFTPVYSPWRHGGSYVTNIVYPSGAVGCIAHAEHTTTGKYEIACYRTDGSSGFASLDEAAHAELTMACAKWEVFLAGACAFTGADHGRLQNLA